MAREKKFKCDKCPYTASDRSNLQKHVKGVHEKVKPFQFSVISNSLFDFLLISENGLGKLNWDCESESLIVKAKERGFQKVGRPFPLPPPP